MLELKKISKEEVDDSYKEFKYAEHSHYQLSSKAPTHFTAEIVEKGRYKGFDKITYYRGIKLLVTFIFLIFR